MPKIAIVPFIPRRSKAALNRTVRYLATPHNHVAALRANPFDGHTLDRTIKQVEASTGVTVQRIHVDKGYRGHDYPNKLKVWITGQVRRVTKTIRRAAIKPVIGHIKANHRMDRNFLKGRDGDKANAVLAAAAYNFGIIIRWLIRLLCAFLLIPHFVTSQASTRYQITTEK